MNNLKKKINCVLPCPCMTRNVATKRTVCESLLLKKKKKENEGRRQKNLRKKKEEKEETKEGIEKGERKTRE